MRGGEAIEKSNTEWVIALDITEETSVLLDVLQTTQVVLFCSSNTKQISFFLN